MERIWSGRFDGEDLLSRRLFRLLKRRMIMKKLQIKAFLHGFAVDEGVKRNKGRVGAAAAPNVIRKNMSNFPVVSPSFRLLISGIYTARMKIWKRHNKVWQML